MSQLARQVMVLHREEGYLRFALPAALRTSPALAAIEAALLRLPGVRRAAGDVRHGKLAVHFDPHACGTRQVALALDAALAALPPATDAPSGSARRTAADVPARADASPALTRLRQRAVAWARVLGHRAQAARHLLQAKLARPAAGPAGDERTPLLGRVIDPSLINERTAINFLNDVLAFYLIRTHWDLITQRWLREPLRHGNAWLAVFYLTFLLVRYRKQVARAPRALPAPETTP